MTAEIDSLVRFLNSAQFVTEGVGRPDNPTDAEGVLASLHPLLATAEGLHDDIVGCFGLIDEAGRCVDCGRLVVLGMWRNHKEGGCLMAVPVLGTVLWLFQHREGIPLIGQWVWRRRRSARIDPSARRLPPPAPGEGQP